MFLPLQFTSGRAIIESQRESDTVAQKTATRNATPMFYREERVRMMLLDAGKLVRASALGHGEMVKVWFQEKNGEGKYFLMGTDTYRAFPLVTALTVEDFAAVGPVVEATVPDLYDPS